MCVAVGNSGQVATNKASIFSRLLSYLLKRGIGNVIRHIQVLRRMPLRRAEAGVDVVNKILHSIARLKNAFWLDKISHVGNLNIQSEYFSSSWLCNIKFCSITLGPSYFCENLSICGCCVEKGLVDVWVMEKGFTSNIVFSLWSNPGWRSCWKHFQLNTSVLRASWKNQKSIFLKRLQVAVFKFAQQSCYCVYEIN